jgi:hypothetical protein
MAGFVELGRLVGKIFRNFFPKQGENRSHEKRET